jgi:hypothetical protein
MVFTQQRPDASGVSRRPAVFSLALLSLLAGCRTVTATGPRTATPASARPAITLKHGSVAEVQTRAQLERLFDTHELSAFFFAPAVEIDEDAIPHSHPLLTLHTRHLHDDLLLLATYIHEQSHHFCQQNREQLKPALSDVEAAFPGMPVGYPDGANDHDSSYEHLACVIPLEYFGLVARVGELQAFQALDFWSEDHYRVLYETFLHHRGAIWGALKKTGLTLPK